jgi:hypothetical protein
VYFFQHRDDDTQDWKTLRVFPHNIPQDKIKTLGETLAREGCSRLVKITDNKLTEIVFEKQIKPKKPRKPRKRLVFVVTRFEKYTTGMRYIDIAYLDGKTADKYVSDQNDYYNRDEDVYSVEAVELLGTLPASRAERHALKECIAALQSEVGGQSTSCQKDIVPKCQCVACVIQRSSALLAKK